MYKICNFLLVLGACTGNRKQSTPKQLSSLGHSIISFHLFHHILGTGLGVKVPTWILLSSTVCVIVNFSGRKWPVPYLKYRISKNLKRRKRNKKNMKVNSIKPYAQLLGGQCPYISCYRIPSMLFKFCAAINVHLFIYYFYLFPPSESLVSDIPAGGGDGNVANLFFTVYWLFPPLFFI